MSGAYRRPEDDRRFTAGQRFEIDGIEYRVMSGRKGPGDLRLDWYTPSGWRPLTFESPFVIADFLYENEDVLHPRPAERGGLYFMDGIRRAVRHGYVAAWSYVQSEKRQRGGEC